MSRAVIKKGCLTCIQRVTLAGHAYTIMDEQQQICNDPLTTGIWVSNHFYRTTSNTDASILIPFSIADKQNEKIILVHKNFASLKTITLQRENYNFKCAYIYNQEQLIQ